MSDKKQFTVGQVQHITKRSKEIGSSEISKVGVRSAQVGCLCGHVWNATERDGLRNVMGAIRVECPACHATAELAPREFGL